MVIMGKVREGQVARATSGDSGIWDSGILAGGPAGGPARGKFPEIPGKKLPKNPQKTHFRLDFTEKHPKNRQIPSRKPI